MHVNNVHTRNDWLVILARTSFAIHGSFFDGGRYSESSRSLFTGKSFHRKHQRLFDESMSTERERSAISLSLYGHTVCAVKSGRASLASSWQ